jgi:putative tricarboxylic transport membrane protein
MALDRVVALIFLLISLIYGFSAFNYPLLPFERNMPFLPNTLPMALSVLGTLVSLFILLSPRRSGPEDELGKLDLATLRTMKVGQALGLVAAMALYAVLLRPIGFLAATTLFIAGSACVLGERRFHILVPIAVIAAVGVWYLVQETLGIFLRPWPFFLD